MPEAADRLRAELRAIGFDEVRFAAVDGGASPGLREWLRSGYQADMHWLERTADQRMDPGLVLPGARSAIMLGITTWTGEAASAAGRPVIARYARFSDYHDTIKTGLQRAGAAIERLFGVGAADYRYYVDAGPVGERGWAARAGLGFVGKNAMLISRRHGNWLLLAAILTRVELPPDDPILPRFRAGARTGLLCGKCTRCLDACPTDAFPRPGVVDSRRCIAYQTIENRGYIPRGLRAAIGSRVFGCDTCLDVCPWNRFARAGRQMLLESRAELAALSWRDLLELTPARFAAVFRKAPVKRLKLPGLLRNACIGAGNSGDGSLLPELSRLARHESPVVRAHAVWAVRRLAGADWKRWLEAARTEETSPEVLAEYQPDLAG